MRKTIAAIIITALGYFLLGEAGLLLAIPPGYASAVFPAAALAFIAVLQAGLRVLPGIWLGSFAINLGIAWQSAGIGAMTANIFWTAASIAAGACMQAWLASALVRYRLKTAWQTLDHDADILWFLLLAGPLAGLLSCSWAAATLLLSGAIETAELPFTWWNWWVGDVLGVLLFAPVLLALLQRRQPLWRTRLRNVVGPTVLVTAAIVATFIYVSDKDYRLLKYRIDSYGQALTNLINLHLLGYLETVATLARLPMVSPALSHTGFASFTQPMLKQHPDIDALSWNPLVTANRRSAFEAQFAAENALPGFYISELDANRQLAVAKPRDWYVAVGYITPQAGNQKALGYDIASDPKRLHAIQASMQSGQLTSTPPIRLVQDNGDFTSLLLLQAVYGKDMQNALPIGFAVGVFKVEAMLQQQVARQLPAGLAVSLEDLGGDAGNPMLYSNRNSQAYEEAALVWTQTLNFAGRTWRMSLYPSAEFLSTQRTLFAWLILAGGLIVASLLQAMLLGITGRNFVIQRLVEQQTREISQKNLILRESERHLRREKEKYQTLMYASGDGIHILDLQGRVVEANQKFCELLGYGYEEIIGMHVSQWEAHFDAAAAATKIQENFDIANVFETRHRRKTGEVIDIEVSAKAVMIDQQKLLWNASRDISERKMLQHEFIQAKEVAEAASKAKSAFLANISHEIRTPINAIIGLTELTLDNQLGSKQRDYLTKIRQASKSLLGIVDNVLDFSKIEADKIDIEVSVFVIEDLLQDIIDSFAEPAAVKGLELFVETAPEALCAVSGDVLRIRQVLDNLVNNALKFTERGEIHIKAEVAGHSEDSYMLSFTVRDTGIGLSRQEMDGLFQSFTQVDASASRRFGGVGLGLAICRRLAELMGGHITVSSRLGEGSAFVFSVPVNAEAASRPQQPLPFAHGKRVLVVDDMATSCRIIKRYLETWQFDVVTCLSAHSALQLFEQVGQAQQPFDLLLVDRQMLDTDGLQLLKQIEDRINKHGLRQPPALIMVCRDKLPQLSAKALTEILVKPVTLSNLYRALLHVYQLKLPDMAQQRPVSTREQEQAIEVPPGFDFSNILPLLNDDVAKLLQVLTMFKDEFADAAGDIDSSIDKGDWVLAEQRMHRLKGVAGNIGAMQLHRLSQLLDDQLKQHYCDAGLLKQWRIAYADTLQAVGVMLEQRTQGVIEAGSENNQQLRKQLAAHIDDLLAQHDFISSDLLAEFNTAIDPQQREDYNGLVRCIKKLNYAEARTILLRLS